VTSPSVAGIGGAARHADLWPLLDAIERTPAMSRGWPTLTRRRE
jgi:hypothetical protein